MLELERSYFIDEMGPTTTMQAAASAARRQRSVWRCGLGPAWLCGRWPARVVPKASGNWGLRRQARREELLPAHRFRLLPTWRHGLLRPARRSGRRPLLRFRLLRQ